VLGGAGVVNNNFLILLVDDEAFAREIVCERLLTLPGVTVAAECANGIAASEYLLSHKVDMLITDIMMTGMDGLELAEFCHRLDSSCNMVIISGHNEFEYARRALKYGVKDYFLKPVQMKNLLELVTACQSETERRRRYLSAHRMSEHDALESQLRELIASGEVDEKWLAELKKLMPSGGRIARLEVPRMPVMDEDALACFLRNMLCLALPGQTVLWLYRQENQFDFLVVDREDSQSQRDLSAAEEYLNRVLNFETRLTQAAVLQSAEALRDYHPQLPDGDQKNELIAIACRYMEAHLNEPISRDQVAQVVYLTSPYFSSLFRKVTGMTYSDYLVDLRVRHAMKLLEKKLSIREVAEAVGYRNMKYFNRIFKSKVGYLPSEYRKLLMKGLVGDKA